MNDLAFSSSSLTSRVPCDARVRCAWRLTAVLTLMGVLACGTDSSGVSEATDVSPGPSVSTTDGTTSSATSSGSSSTTLATTRQGNSPIAPSTRDTMDESTFSTTEEVSTSAPTASAPSQTSDTVTSIGESTSSETSTTDRSQSSGTTSDPGSDVTSDGPLLDITIFLAGDSTVSQYADTASDRDQAGWGQMLHQYLAPQAKVDNRAIGGRTARRFIDEGALAQIARDIESGDVLMVQFGTNDGNRNAMYEHNGMQIPYYLDPATDFKKYLNEYIDLALERDATPILVTPPPRNSAYCTGGNGTGGHAQAMRELGAERGVTVADLNTRSVDYLKAICPAPTPEDFFLLRADGTVDGTHFQENGARLLASFVAAEVKASNSLLARYVELP